MSRGEDDVLVKVEGVSTKFCRSLKKSLWYGVCDIASELNPFGRSNGQSTAYNNLTTECTESTEGGTGLRLADQAGAAFSNPTTSGLAVDSQNTSLARAASNPCSSGEKALDSGRSPLGSTHGLRAGEFFAVKDVSFELRRGECLGLIGHNGAGNQAAGQPLGPRQPGGCTGDCRKAARRVRRVGTSESTLPQPARRVRRRGKARINMTLLKMLNGLIKPDAGSITMRGRVGALIALGAGFNPSREPKGWEARRTSNRRLARRVQLLRKGANQNIYINGSVLGLTKTD